MRQPRLELGLVPAALLLALWGLFDSGADPVRTRVLVAEAGDHDPHGPWGLQTVEAALQLRPWQEGYGEARRAVGELTAVRREGVLRW